MFVVNPSYDKHLARLGCLVYPDKLDQVECSLAYRFIGDVGAAKMDSSRRAPHVCFPT